MKGLRQWPPLLRSPLSGSIRARIVALALLAAIPAIGMAGIIAGQDYRGRERVAVEHADRQQSVTVARLGLALTAMTDSLDLLVKLVSISPPDCSAILAAVPGPLGRAPSALALFAPDGRRLCGNGLAGLALDNASGLSWFERARSGATPAWSGDAAGHSAPVVAVRTPTGGVIAGALPLDWFAAVSSTDPATLEAATWLFDGEHNLVAWAGLGVAALPNVALLTTLLNNDHVTPLAASAGGVPYAYAATKLPNGWQLIGAYRATHEHLKARRVLFARLADLLALLLLGLAVTVLGADIAFGEPLRRLRTALAEWQAGADFDEADLASAPTELVELARSFNQAAVSLRAQKAELGRAQTRQGLLMLEIHHRVKNNLQIVASLLNLQASRIRVPEARAEFQSARDRVRALATLHRHLYAEGEIHTINMANFLAELCGQLFQAMGETPGGRIKLILDAEEIRLSTDQAVPLALIVTEAMTNAIKYGFPGGLTGSVSVTLAQRGETLDLVIADDGVGIPPGRSETESGTRDGIGLQLIRGFSRQLGAALEVREHPGTRYRISMKLHPGGGQTVGELGMAS